MKTITLLALKIENFKGIKSFEIKDVSGDLKIMGDNGTGKTSIADAVAWLFTDKDLNGRKDFSIKPLDTFGQEIHNLETVVQGTFCIETEGELVEIVTIKKLFKENYSTKAGSPNPEFVGHTTDHWIDSVYKKQKEFRAFLDELFDEETYRLVSDPYFFSTMPWKRRRDILLTMTGDVQNEAVIDSDVRLEPLRELLKKKNIDDIRSMTSESLRNITKDFKEIGPRMGEVSRAIGTEPAPNPKALELLNAKLDEARGKVNAFNSNQALADYRKRVSDIEAEISQRKLAQSNAMLESRKPAMDKITALQPKVISLNSRLGDLESIIKLNTKRNEIAEEAMQKLRDDWAAEKDRMPNTKGVCDFCGQDLPENMINQAREKFNNAKAAKLKEISEEGKTLGGNVEDRTKAIEQAKSDIETLSNELEETTKELKSLEDTLSGIVPDQDPEIEKLLKAKATVEDLIKTMMDGSKAQLDEATEELNKVQSEINAWNKIQAVFEASEKARARLKELEDQEQVIKEEHDRLSNIMFLTDQFLLARVTLLEDKVNSVFTLATIKMFHPQVNGGIKDCCEVLCAGVPFSMGLNTAAKMNAGLDGCNVLSEFYGVRPPVWVDNKESVNNLYPIKAQVISMTVTNDEELNLEQTGKEQ